MRRLIRADLGRILRKPGFYVLYILMIVFMVTGEKEDSSSGQVEMLKMLLQMMYLNAALIPIFLSVYGDEIKSGQMIGIIGRGLSRKKLIIAKLLDASILLLGSFAAAFAAVWLRSCLDGPAFTPKQTYFLFLYCLFCVIRGIGFFAIASLVVFLAWSASGGMFILLLASLLSSVFLKAAQSKLSLPIYDYSFEGLLDAAYADAQMGKAAWQLIPALLVYLGGVLAIQIILFKRKELEL